MKITNDLLRETALYVENYMQENNNPSFYYHNYNHTLNVVRACDIISMNCELGKQERLAIHLAAWFHDIGYFTNPEDHEATGAAMAVEYFKAKGLEKETLSAIENCILATRIPQQPTTLMEQVICDADLNQLGSKEEENTSDLLRKEFAVLKNKDFTEEEWIRFNLAFMKSHIYFTNFARNEFEKQKSKNIAVLEKRLQDLLEPEKENTTTPAAQSDLHAAFEKDIKLERGVETFFRITSGNQLNLNDMADKKAGLIISTNTLIISIVLSVLAPKLRSNPQLLVPVVLLLVPCVIAILLGVLATRPKIISKKSSDPGNKGIIPNIMFFGHFHKMSMTEYQHAVKEIMYNRDNLYEEITKDIYLQGQVLSKKFRLIAVGYIVFMAGLIISVISFLTIFIINSPK